MDFAGRCESCDWDWFGGAGGKREREREKRVSFEEMKETAEGGSSRRQKRESRKK